MPNWYALASVLLACLALEGCSRIPGVIDARDLKPVIQQSRSPTGSFQVAMISRGYGGAVGGTTYLVYIRRRGAQKAYLMLRGLRLLKVSFEWHGDNMLDISMACGDVQAFSNNFYYRDKKANELEKVTLNLHSDAVCPPLP